MADAVDAAMMEQLRRSGIPMREPKLGSRKHRSTLMDWDRIEGNWKQFTGKVKEKWGDLTDDDVSKINGNREQLEGVLQERYGYAKDKAREEVDSWSRNLG
jgi:uncharacterized protein YjbJ (UPF0337 family)